MMDKFRARVDDSAGPNACHPWTGEVNQKGYGRFRIDGRRVTAGRWLLGHLRGEPLGPDEWALHHCDNPPCVNPKHLYVGSAAQNSMDSVERGSHPMARKTHCKQGHEFTPENTGRETKGRYCRTCSRAMTRRWRARRAVGSDA